MLNWLVRSALEKRVLVLMGAVVLIVLGIRTASRTNLDVFPEFAPPRVEVQTEAPGLSVEEVDSLVTVPLENALNGTPFVDHIRSKSVLGLSSITLLFRNGTDLNDAHQWVQSRLSRETGTLPEVAHAPVILPPLSSTSRVLKIGMSSKILSQMDLSEIAKWKIRPRLMALPGVANVAIWGQRDRQFQILVDPERLMTNDTALADVIASARESVAVGAGGFVDTPNQRLSVTHESPVREPEDLARSVVSFRDGYPLLLGDIAEVRFGSPPPIGDAVINDGPGLLLVVEMYPWGNTLEVTQSVEEALDFLRPGLGDVQLDSTIFRPATFIETALHNLTQALVAGCLLVIVVLLLFLADWRAALISILAIPLSLVTAALVIHFTGSTINTMVLAGMVIALGAVVDDAIIDVENISRRLRQNAQSNRPDPPYKVVLQASLEVRSAIVYASLIVILVFLPVFFLEGLAGAFFKPLAFSYVLSILASLIVALTVTPALSLILLPRSSTEPRDPRLTSALKKVYRALLPFALARPSLSKVLPLLLYGAMFLTIPKLGEEFFPKFQERDFLMHWVEKPGTSLEAMKRITLRAGKELLAIPGVRNFGAHIGRAEVADEVVGPNFTELWISVDEQVDYKETLAKIQSVVDGYPGLYRDVLTYLSERIKEVLSGSGASIVVRVFGPDLAVLRSTAHDVADAMKEVEGVTDLKVEQQVLVPQIKVTFQPEAGNRMGIKSADVLRAANTLIKGTKVGEVYEDQKLYDVIVWGVDRVRRDIASIQNILVESPGGVHTRLGDVANVSIEQTPNAIFREESSRRIDITCNANGRDLGSVARDIERKVQGLSFEEGYHPEVLGEYAELQSARRRLLGLAVLAVIGVLVLLHTDFQSVKLVLLIAFTLPFALVGGVVGAFVGGGILSLGSLVGFVTVLGIAARNGIMLISHYRHLEEEEGMEFGLPLVLRGAEERLAPILMTALTTALALLPIALGGNQPGYEIEYPMALVIVWGLLTSTILNLFLLPSLYLGFGSHRSSNSPDCRQTSDRGE